MFCTVAVFAQFCEVDGPAGHGGPSRTLSHTVHVHWMACKTHGFFGDWLRVCLSDQNCGLLAMVCPAAAGGGAHEPVTWAQRLWPLAQATNFGEAVD